ncbi:hypothetical protein AAOE16_16805 [Ekhidna sp. MALMAid0563]|uniref:hypothetical protein n=1 Tax=Ekhidna sp. MALMAid0563 TaxID=3143937 RepID=UPI0032DEE9ED
MKLFIKVCFIFLILLTSCGVKKSSKEETKPRPPKEQAVLEKPSFDYQPRVPENGELNAVIELGSLGLNYFIVEIDNDGCWRLERSSYGRSNFIYGVNTNAEIIANIKTFKNEIVNYGVNPKNIHLIASSSVVKSEDIPALNSQLTDVSLKIESINAADEARYALLATVPREFIDESFIVDIGSGNTKLAWVEKDDTLSVEIHGSKYFLSEVQDTTVFREVRDALLQVPEKNRNLCFMLGGMIFEFVKGEVEGSDDRYFVLDPPNEYPIDNEKLKAANVIYNALYLEPTFSYIFDRDSNFSIGYLVSQKQ